jgi:hypothetical protein
MSERVQEPASLSRAARRVAWGSRALAAAAADLDAVGATAAGEVLWREAERVEQLAEQVRALALAVDASHRQPLGRARLPRWRHERSAPWAPTPPAPRL